MSEHQHDEGHECAVCSLEGTLEERMARYWIGFREKIARYGHAVAGVIGGNGNDFFYTVGASGSAGAELIVFGNLDGGSVLNDLIKKMESNGGPFKDGEIVKLGDGSAKFGVKLIDASFKKATEEYMFQATKYWNEEGVQDFTVMQVLVPDKNGVYPDEPGCQPPFSKQPLLREVN